MEKHYILSSKVIGFRGVSDEMNETIGIFTLSGLKKSNYALWDTTWDKLIEEVPPVEDDHLVGIWMEAPAIDVKDIEFTDQDRERLSCLKKNDRETDDWLREFHEQYCDIYVAEVKINS